MNNTAAKALLIKYRAGQCTEAEKAMLYAWYLQYNEHETAISPEKIAAIGEAIYAGLPGVKPVKRLKIWPAAAAVAAMLILTIGVWYVFDRATLPARQVIVKDVNPGSNKATLTLSSGKKINLNGAKTGLIIKGHSLRYLDGSAIALANANDAESNRQTLSTPMGGEYQVLLADGTKVWLNASSSLTYPATFDAVNKRVVELNGEAYFEVAPNKLKPFLVKTALQTVEVLGTHFNINSYNDNGSTITTLEEGSVNVFGLAIEAGNKVKLKPGQQSLTSAKGIKVQNADLETDLAWKNGRIEFKDADLQTIMKQISRWYNITVEYRGQIPLRVFNGSISRQSNLSVLLKILAYSDIHFTIVEEQGYGKKLIVTP